MSRFLAPRCRSLEEYTPGEQPRDKKYIKLNTNESPYPPSPQTIAAVNAAEISALNLYPDPTCAELKNAIAERYGFERKNIFVSNGSDDILNFSFMAFAGQGGTAVFPDITYGFYEVFCALHGVNARIMPLGEDFSINSADYMSNDALVVIANPNAPTGKLLGTGEIEKILIANPDRVVLIDEAYIDFGGETALPLIKEHNNLLVVRTYSKSRSLAGARLGFAIGNEELIKDLEKIKFSTNPYSINRLTLTAGTAAILSDDYYAEKCAEIISAREYTMTELKKLGFTVTDSFANFVFAKKDGVSGEYIYNKLREKGILVRHFGGERIKEYNRITIGTPEQMNTFIARVREILSEVQK